MQSYKGLSLEGRREYWREQFKKWKESGLSQSEFCKINDLKFTTFNYWNNRLRKEDRNKKLFKLPSKIAHGLSGSENIFELIINDSMRIRIPGNFEEISLKKLLRTLGVFL